MAGFSLSLCDTVSQEERVAETVEVRDEQEQTTTRRGRKRIRKDDVRCKKKGLRKNAPETNIGEVLEKTCCKKVCVSKFSQDHLVSIREHFNCLTYDEQNLYLTGMITRKDTKKSSGHKRKENPVIGKNGKKIGRPPAESSEFSVEYHIRNQKGIDIKVCQKAFIWIHGFGKRRLEVLRKKFLAGFLLPEPDQRGRHVNRPNKVSEELHQKVCDHIASFPSRPSHYSRHRNSSRLYLSPDLSIERMYELFLSAHNPEYLEYIERKKQALINHETVEIVEVKPIVTKHYYNDTFVNEFNLHFGYPRSDTCDTCDHLNMEISTKEDDEKARLQKQLNLDAAEKGYDRLRKDIQACKESWSHVQSSSDK